MNCPLCDYSKSRPSWVGSTYYLRRAFSYFECLSCGSLYCDPMPDAETLAQMYGPDYGNNFGADPSGDDSKDSRRVLELVKKLNAGTFIDYGCGGGELLVEVAKLEWRAIGIEFDPQVATAVEDRTGLQILTQHQAEKLPGLSVDILHLGDVIEHLTDLDCQMPEIVKLVRPGGLVVAQGPLEANLCLFTLLVRFTRALRRERRTEMAPYHVLLATAKGQRSLFQRLGLREIEYQISEVAWPAPARLSLADIWRLRSITLFVLRRVSQAISALGFAQMGNRYFYVGQRI